MTSVLYICVQVYTGVHQYPFFKLLNMQLQQCVPPVNAELVRLLQDVGIKTDFDLLLGDDPTSIFTKLPPGHDIGLKEFREMTEKVAEIASATPTCGDRLLEQEAKRHENIFTDDMLVGVPEVDAAVGGFSPPRVVEISGDTNTGKTVSSLPTLMCYLPLTCSRLSPFKWPSDTYPESTTPVSFGSIPVEISPQSEFPFC